MNSTAAYRRSIIAPRDARATMIVDRVLTRRRTIQPVDWLAYKEECEAERASDVVPEESSTFDTFSIFETEHIVSNPLERVRRMFTVFPYRDLEWINAVIFTIGSMLFIVNAFFTVLPIVAPETIFEGELTIGIPATLTIAGSMFFISTALGFVAAFNAGRGGHDAVDKKASDSSVMPPSYCPALLGSAEFRWHPTFKEFRTVYLPNPAFQTSLVALLGVIFLSSALVFGFPGVLDPASPQFPQLMQFLVFLPITIGTFLLGVAAFVLTIMAQDKWYKPALTKVAWHTSFWNLLGAVGFVVSGSITLLAPTAAFQSALASFIGSWTFLFGALLQWYMIMDYYPRK